MAGRPTPTRKRRTREHVIADLGVNHVERQVLLAGYTIEKRIHDYGIDLVLLTYDDAGQVENGEVLLQVKATERLSNIRSGRFVSFRIERADLRAWLTESYPVVLIVYDVSTDRAYWLYEQSAFSGAGRFSAARGSERLTVHIPSAQVLDRAVVRRFRDFKERILEQIRGVVHRDE